MIEFLFAAIIVLLAFGGMAIGVIAGRGPLKGGCGRSDESCDGHCAKQCERRADKEED